MTVLILLNSRFPTEKAYGLQVEAMARGFSESDIHVSVVYPKRTKQRPELISGVRFVPYGPYMPLRFPMLFTMHQCLGLIGLGRVLRAEKPDMCLVNDPAQAAFLPQPWKLVWDLHDIPDPRRITRRWMIRKILQRASGIVSTNELKLERLRALGFRLPPSIVLPNPVTFDPARYRSIDPIVARRQLGMGEGERHIVYAGQLYAWKGVDTLIEAAKHLSPLYRIHIVGGMGSDFERCRKLVAGLPTGVARVIMHGQKPADKIPSWLRAATVIVIPNSGKHRLSVEDTNPLKAYEALAAEAAIVASDLPAIRHALDLSGAAVFFKPDDASDLARAIERVCSDETELKRLRARASGATLVTGKQRAAELRDFFARLR